MIRIDTSAPAVTPHPLGLPYWHQLIARHWLRTYLTYTADHLQQAGNHQAAAAYRAAATTACRHGQATTGHLIYQASTPTRETRTAGAFCLAAPLLLQRHRRHK
ncbi:hypothetical protein SMC26_13915 [Actinomadura fulvescens]|uniref:Uncharacterized protein n=1 Tax=Actinomadura fulvescens TaxID=46160 RepID=A0ABP6CC81_9ACTN